MWDFSVSVDDFDLVDGVYAWTEAAVYAENVIVNDNCESEKVEHVGKIMPHVGIAVFARTFGVKAVGLGDSTGFMVATDQVDSLRPAEL